MMWLGGIMMVLAFMDDEGKAGPFFWIGFLCFCIGWAFA